MFQKKLVQFSVKVEVDDYSNSRKIPMATLELTEDVTTGVIYDKTLTDGSLTMTLSFKVRTKISINISSFLENSDFKC